MEIVLLADALEGLRTLEPESVHTCVTSPPYYNLRDYGVAGQIGNEDTPEKFVEKLVEVFREVRRVLRPDGTLWVNIGDSYATRSGPQPPTNTRNSCGHTAKRTPSGYKYKDLIGIPWLLAFALRADGWYLRQDIIWNKPNCMPESVRDRCTKSHEYVFLLSKSERYYFNPQAIREPAGTKGNARSFRGGGAYTGGRSFNNSAEVARESHGNVRNDTGTRNTRRNCWKWPANTWHKESHLRLVLTTRRRWRYKRRRNRPGYLYYISSPGGSQRIIFRRGHGPVSAGKRH